MEDLPESPEYIGAAKKPTVCLYTKNKDQYRFVCITLPSRSPLRDDTRIRVGGKGTIGFTQEHVALLGAPTRVPINVKH